MKKRYPIILLLLVAAVFSWAYPVLFQEGNPLPIANGAVELSVHDKDIAQISTDPLRYISKSSAGDAPIINLMDQEGWIFVEQFGSGYLFSKEDSSKTVSSVQYTKLYRIWGIPSD